ncbi:hypothetical protein [Streptomyces tauricus]
MRGRTAGNAAPVSGTGRWTVAARAVLIVSAALTIIAATVSTVLRPGT